MVSTLGGCAVRESGFVCIEIEGGISVSVSGFNAPKRYRSLAMASSWLWCDVAGVSCMAQKSSFKAWIMRSLVVIVVWIT